jgi:hypothetical protein
MSQNEHFTGIWGILWILWVILQVCFSELYSSVYNQFQDGGCVSLRDEWQIIFLAISLNFHRIVVCFHVVLYCGFTLYELTYFVGATTTKERIRLNY